MRRGQPLQCELQLATQGGGAPGRTRALQARRCREEALPTGEVASAGLVVAVRGGVRGRRRRG
jgi:hypothetical protein